MKLKQFISTTIRVTLIMISIILLFYVINELNENYKQIEEIVNMK